MTNFFLFPSADRRPFVLQFVTNSGEADANSNNHEDDDSLDLGFSLNYRQVAC